MGKKERKVFFLTFFFFLLAIRFKKNSENSERFALENKIGQNFVTYFNGKKLFLKSTNEATLKEGKKEFVSLLRKLEEKYKVSFASFCF